MEAEIYLIFSLGRADLTNRYFDFWHKETPPPLTLSNPYFLSFLCSWLALH
ncbi:hypothetical protein HMPREF1423_00567 [Helicobacter pylori GAM270ASi]|nr:hypothetical protein HMPREF1423_00567 [Helicobacter pylori GAM270ASi]